MVEEGQSILIISDLNGIKVKMEGNALQNGHFNELIKVKNLSSGKIVQGKIVNEKRMIPMISDDATTCCQRNALDVLLE